MSQLEPSDATKLQQNASGVSEPHKRDAALMLIAAFKLIKGSLLLLLALEAHRLMHKDVAEVVEHWIQHFRADPNSKYLHLLLGKLPGVTDKRLKELSVGTFIYGALFLTEGMGLALRKRWAEYMTIITTGLLIPLEIYEIFHHTGPRKVSIIIIKVVVFLINVAIVAYLIRRVRPKQQKF